MISISSGKVLGVVERNTYWNMNYYRWSCFEGLSFVASCGASAATPHFATLALSLVSLAKTGRDTWG